MRGYRSGHVVVVGAGIAGLTAAHRLAEAGAEVSVLEAARGPGGRMSTQAVGEGLMERGAAFLSTGYEVIPRLLQAAGLAGQAVKVSGRTLVVADGRSWRFDTGRPWSVFTGGLLRARDIVPAAQGLWLARKLAARPTSDLGGWSDLDAHDGRAWAQSRLGPALTRRLLLPTVNGFYFRDLTGDSAVLPGALAAFSARRASAFTLSGGLGSLTAALAAKSQVEYGVRVEHIERPRSGRGRVILSTSRGRREAGAVVIATPAGPAARMLADPAPDEAALLRTPYTSGLVAGLALAAPLADDELAGAYGIVVTPDSSSPLAAIAVYSRADAAGAGEVLTVYFRHDAARRLMAADDATVAAAAIDAVAPWLPGLGGRITGSQVVRWPQALPCVPVGHVTAVRRYRDRLPTPSPVLLAGDYLGSPWSDAAAFNGHWAADRLIADHAG